MFDDMMADLIAMATATSWMEDGLCTEADPEMFFPEMGCNVGAAKRVCAPCPVRQQCLDYALSLHIQHGVWGGMTLGERRRVRRLHLAA